MAAFDGYRVKDRSAKVTKRHFRATAIVVNSAVIHPHLADVVAKRSRTTARVVGRKVAR